MLFRSSGWMSLTWEDKYQGQAMEITLVEAEEVGVEDPTTIGEEEVVLVAEEED